jgi:CRISPR-associated protein Cst1
MKKIYNSIDYEWLSKPTGDPFADVGGYVIKYLSEKYPGKDILELIEYMAKIYVNKWSGKINPFFLNSDITNPNPGEKDLVKGTMKYFTSLINETANYEIGFCRISGRQTKLYKAGRKNSIMSGSGKFVNFHHNFQFGMMVSKEMLIRMFFIPYGTILVGGRIAIIHSNNEEVNTLFVNRNCKANDGNIAMASSDGVLRSDYGIPTNALFHFVDDMFINRLNIATNDTENLSLTLYHCTNFGASPELVIYTLPANIFRFYSTCQSNTLKSDWQPFLMAHYINSKYEGATYNQSISVYELSKKNNIEQIAYNEYKTWHNIVLDNLLEGKSLLKLFLNWGIKHKFDFKIVELYQKYVRNMRKETLDKIKELALFLTNEDESTIKKSIRSLNGYKSAYELRRFFLKNIVAKNYSNGADSTIITVEELIYYLFPDDISWKDIRDILLFAIYQELHAKNISVDVKLNEEENDNENMENE